MAVEDALGVALALYRQPALVVDWRDRALPPDVELLLRVACREQAALQQARQRSGMSEDEAVEAAVFGVQQLLFGPRADAYRVLGGSIDSTQSQLRQHYRWLIKWLHPDRHDDGWEPVYADRVNLAWQALKTPERRARYDAEQGYESSLREDFGGFAGDNVVETEAPSVTTSPSGDTAIPVIHQRRASHGAASSPAATPLA